jgi:hypothetical protein
MDKPKCRLCGERHYGNCAGVTPTRGDPRAETNPTILSRQVADKPPPRRPTPWDPKPVTKPVASCNECVALRNEIVALKADATLYRNKIAALETELRIELNKTRSKPTPLSSTERSRRRRERQATKIRPAPKPQ